MKSFIIGLSMIIIGSSTAYSTETYKTCKFDFESEGVSQDFGYTEVAYKIRGVHDFDKIMYSDLCKEKTNAHYTITSIDIPKKHETLFKIKTNGCSFKYKVRISGDTMYRTNHYRDTCRQTNDKSWTLQSKSNPDYEGTTTYRIKCENGRLEFVHYFPATKHYGSHEGLHRSLNQAALSECNR